MELAIIVSIFLFVFGFIGVINGEFKITGKRWVDSSTGRLMGIIMLVGAVAPFCIGGWFAFFAQWGSLILAIAIGLARSEEIERVGQGLAGYDLVTRWFRKSVTRLGWGSIKGLLRSEVVTNWLRPA